jgi:topoisomerase-4 subunit A
VRARWRIEDQARGQWRVVFTELPHGVSTRDVLEDIERATNPRPKEGKKALSPDQANLKALMLAALETVRDESDKAASVRLVCEPRSSRQDPDEFIRLLLVNTRLESSLQINLVMLGRDGRPRSKHLREILQEWISFRLQTVTRRTRFRLDEVDRRIHILEGRALALLDIDAVIRVIREADEPRSELMRAFSLSELQAEDILEIRLRQLARLEAIRIEKELKELTGERRGLQRILDSRAVLEKLVADEIKADAEKYGDARRTLIEAVAPAVLVQSAPDEPVTITLSRNGWIRARQGHGLDAAQFTYKAGDAPFAVLETRTVLPVILLDSEGRAYSLRAAEIPGGRGDGVPVTTLIDVQTGARIAHVLSAPPEARVLVAGSGAYGFITTIAEMVSRVRAGKAFMSLEQDERPLPPCLLAAEDCDVAALSEGGRLLLFGLDEMKEMPRGRGVILMGLEAGESLLCVCALDRHGLLVEGPARGGALAQVALSGAELDRYRLHRARKGSRLETRVKPRTVQRRRAP